MGLNRNILVFWTEQLAMTIVVVLYAFAIALRSDLDEKDKLDLGGWVITTIVVLLICGVATSMATVFWVHKQIDLDRENDPNGIRIKLRRAVNRIPEYKNIIAVEEQHKISSELQKKTIVAKRKIAKGRIVARIKKQQIINRIKRKNGAKDQSKVVPRDSAMTEESKVEAIRNMMAHVFQTSDRFEKAAERINWTAIGIVQYDVFDRMERNEVLKVKLISYYIRNKSNVASSLVQ